MRYNDDSLNMPFKVIDFEDKNEHKRSKMVKILFTIVAFCTRLLPHILENEQCFSSSNFVYIYFDLEGLH